ncbi:TIP-1 family-domain-containing protein [Cokeromyces recurvatus]|uniref:TIP-1 family-domain-containing protein n=1 Tax=Cokeromyces recurvatus TaxID=90255 RepID=UPI00221E4368|nr:TIP-1 family-domain-containing protein [Cokeromyces recurvatus]KAI7898065.1 TIP-1 family-domain-containing protein [Cokeromyces recurvatus]
MSTVVDELQDYLCSNLQTEQDLSLDNVKRLLQIQYEEKASLDSQLQTLKQTTKQKLSRTLQTSKTHHAKLNELSTSLLSTENTLQTFIHHEPTLQLLSQLTHLEQKIKKIDIAKTYIKSLLVASDLSSQAMELVIKEPQEAITPYKQLLQFESYLEKHAAYKGLYESIKKSRLSLWEQLNDVLTKNFKDTLQDLDWPKPLRPPYGPHMKDKLNAFEKAFSNLLILEKFESDVISNPILIMLEALSIRFRFHFESSKPTNRLDKPEWYLTFVKDTIASHIPFLLTTVQPLCGTWNAKDQFITGLLRDVERKIQDTFPKLLNHPNWLSHTIHEILVFDKSLLDHFAYSSHLSSYTIFTHDAWFTTWFEAERSFALVRFDTIMSDPRAFHVDDTSRATTSAIRLVELLESIRDVYELVPSTEQKCRFLNEIQLDLLDQYQQRISNAIDSFEALSLIRSVPVPGALPEAVTGVMTTTETGGTVAAIHRLYRWWRSVDYIINRLKDWSEDEFFLELQFDINQNHKKLGQDGLFKNSLNTFKQLDLRTEKMMIKIAIKEWITGARKYAKKDTWWQTSCTDITEISHELYQPLQNFRNTFNSIYPILPEAKFLLVYRKTLQEIEDWYWKQIITQNQFSTMGALQLETDLKQGLWKIGQKWTKKPENLMKRLKEAIQLLVLPFDNDTVSCNKLMKALTDTSQLENVQKMLQAIGIEVLSNGQIHFLGSVQCPIDDWRYEMRREIQEIIPGLFLGPFSACRKTNELKDLGITHILCCVDLAEAKLFRTDLLAQHFKYHQLIVTDSNLQNLIQYFPSTSNYIHNILQQQKGKVVVCCNGGMSRSPTFIVAYIMEYFNVDASQAYEFVQTKRLCINPNDGFKSQLKEYEPIYKARLLQSNNQDILQNKKRRTDEEQEETTKRFLGIEEQQQNGVNANMNAGYSSMLL